MSVKPRSCSDYSPSGDSCILRAVLLRLVDQLLDRLAAVCGEKFVAVDILLLTSFLTEAQPALITRLSAILKRPSHTVISGLPQQHRTNKRNVQRSARSTPLDLCREVLDSLGPIVRVSKLLVRGAGVVIASQSSIDSLNASHAGGILCGSPPVRVLPISVRQELSVAFANARVVSVGQLWRHTPLSDGKTAAMHNSA